MVCAFPSSESLGLFPNNKYNKNLLGRSIDLCVLQKLHKTISILFIYLFIYLIVYFPDQSGNFRIYIEKANWDSDISFYLWYHKTEIRIAWEHCRYKRKKTKTSEKALTWGVCLVIFSPSMETFLLFHSITFISMFNAYKIFYIKYYNPEALN